MAEKPKAAVYDESKIKTLSSLEHIRLRTGMYIGRIGTARITTTAVTCCSRRSWIMPLTNSSWATARRSRSGIDGNRRDVRDFGRGIPLGKVVDCVSKINTGAKYNDDVFQFSVGLNGVGTKAVNALSKTFSCAAIARANSPRRIQDRQAQEGRHRQDERAERHVHRVRAGPGDLQEQRVQAGVRRARLRHYSYLNTGLKLILNSPGPSRRCSNRATA
jgi:topoisomerase-4 subunit B